MNHIKNVSVHTLDRYVRETTVVDSREEVAKYICYFLERNRPIFQVRRILSNILLNNELLDKVIIINDKEFYNHPIILKRNAAVFPNEISNIEELNNYFLNTESICLYLLSFDQEEDVRIFYPNSKIDVITDERYILRENSRYAKALRKKTWERQMWPQYFAQRKTEITDMLLDEYANQERLFHFSNGIEHEKKASDILSVIKEYLK